MATKASITNKELVHPHRIFEPLAPTQPKVLVGSVEIAIAMSVFSRVLPQNYGAKQKASPLGHLVIQYMGNAEEFGMGYVKNSVNRLAQDLHKKDYKLFGHGQSKKNALWSELIQFAEGEDVAPTLGGERLRMFMRLQELDPTLSLCPKTAKEFIERYKCNLQAVNDNDPKWAPLLLSVNRSINNTAEDESAHFFFSGGQADTAASHIDFPRLFGRRLAPDDPSGMAMELGKLQGEVESLFANRVAGRYYLFAVHRSVTEDPKRNFIYESGLFGVPIVAASTAFETDFETTETFQQQRFLTQGYREQLLLGDGNIRVFVFHNTNYEQTKRFESIVVKLRDALSTYAPQTTSTSATAATTSNQ